MTTATMFNTSNSPALQPDFLTVPPAEGNPCAVQIDAELRSAYQEVDLLVIEMPEGQPYGSDLLRQVDRSTSVVYLNLAHYRNDPALPQRSLSIIANLSQVVQLRAGGTVKSYQDRDPMLLAALLSARVVVIDEPDGALRNASYHVSRLLRWCVANVALAVIIVRDAESINALCIEHALVRVVRVGPLAKASATDPLPSEKRRASSDSITRLLMQRLGKGDGR